MSHYDNVERIQSLEHLYEQRHDLPVEKRTKAKINKAKTSSFIITVNPNIGDFRFEKNKFIAFVNKLNAVSEVFEGNVNQFATQFPGRKEKFEIPIAVDTHRVLEKGDAKSILHMQMLVKFSNVCWMDQAKIKEFFNTGLREFLNGKSVYVSTRSMKTDDTIKDYLNKAQPQPQPQPQNQKVQNQQLIK